MSSITIKCVEQIFNEIIFEIKEKFSCDSPPEDTNHIRSIAKMLSSCKINEQFIIVIDELSISDVDLLKRFAESIVGLITFYNNSYKNKYIRFIVSTISEPKDIIKNKQKASEYFAYLNSNYWQNSIEKLYDTIIIHLNLKISLKNKQLILKQTDDNPRLLKYLIRKILLHCNFEDDEIQKVVIKAIGESY
ncbi:MAG: hypothetical protein OMM_01530 [Candidatus Magnetoglobus multicellularis str. Araruama]|uniref:KAP NTPase domain-containing protein n=1 Tax=Candidatus Magnetoglobus multicellularis str. Araruama TaxID=890399 RepID=A0A1V1PD30_9BACT|nr:MAG: hypothetical protein OMM_01530 [Candidatus Magnetoglobus multicellularis str. Araruama]